MKKYKLYFLKKIFILITLVFLMPIYTNICHANPNTNTKASATTNITNTSSTKNNTETTNTNTNDNDLVLYSKSSVLIDSTTGQVLYEHNAHEKTYPASTTKLITAILTLENCNLEDSVTIPKESLSGIPKSYTTASLQPNETLTVEQLLNVLLIPSANDAANVLAFHIAGSIEDFSIMMNAKVKEIGCQNTHFVNPSGIHNDEHYSTAYDMALIGKYANTFDKIREIACKTSYSLPDLPNGNKRTFKTTNTLITPNNKYYYEYACGLKTGYTDKAKSCIVAKAKKDNKELICVVLGGDKSGELGSERELDCHTLFEYGFNKFDYYTVCNKNEILQKSNLVDIPSVLQNTDIAFSDDLTVLANVDDYNNITSNINWNSDLQLPIYKDSIVGSITYNIGNEYYTVNLLSNTDILPAVSSSMSQFYYVLIAIFILIVIITIFNNRRKNKFKKKSSKEPKYFKHSLY